MGKRKGEGEGGREEGGRVSWAGESPLCVCAGGGGHVPAALPSRPCQNPVTSKIVPELSFTG